MLNKIYPLRILEVVKFKVQKNRNNTTSTKANLEVWVDLLGKFWMMDVGGKVEQHGKWMNPRQFGKGQNPNEFSQRNLIKIYPTFLKNRTNEN